MRSFIDADLCRNLISSVYANPSRGIADVDHPTTGTLLSFTWVSRYDCMVPNTVLISLKLNP